MAPRKGRGRGRGGAAKRKTEEKDSAVAKVQRSESANTQLRRAIDESKASASQDKKPKTYSPDFGIRCHYTGECTIHEDYTCMLNQTNIGHNNNKFYIIQVAKVKKNLYACYTRWGRVGEHGQEAFDEQKNVEGAIKSFKKKFKDKTKNAWENRENFKAHPGKYTLIEIDEDASSDSESEDIVDAVSMKELGFDAGPCSLPRRTQIMIALIFSEQMFMDQMSSMELDVKRMPLGKLSKSQITKGLESLIDLEDAIKAKKPNQVLMDLSSKFYTLVPHSFGRDAPPVIDSVDDVQKKKDVMMTLSDIELTQSLQTSKQDNKGIHPLVEKCGMLGCKLNELKKNSSQYKLLQEYVYACPESKEKLLDIWEVDRDGEAKRFALHDAIKERKLLWHGTNVAVVAAILNSGLRIMPHSGGRVGRGIYLASEHSKSAGYVGCHYGEFEGEEEVGFMFLVEAALGKEKHIGKDNGNLTKAPAGFDSVVARGEHEPDPKKDKKIKLDGKDVIVPVGKPVAQKQWAKSDFNQSEYLIYQESQARIRYLLKFSFNVD